MSEFLNGVIVWQAWVFGICAYWAPTAVAFARRKRSPVQVALVNLFFGWTVIGWIVALVMAFGVRQRELEVVPA